MSHPYLSTAVTPRSCTLTAAQARNVTDCCLCYPCSIPSGQQLTQFFAFIAGGGVLLVLAFMLFLPVVGIRTHTSLKQPHARVLNQPRSSQDGAAQRCLQLPVCTVRADHPYAQQVRAQLHNGLSTHLRWLRAAARLEAADRAHGVTRQTTLQRRYGYKTPTQARLLLFI